MSRQLNTTTDDNHYFKRCDEIVEGLKNSMTSSSSERQLDCSIMQVRDVLLNGSPEEKEYIFELVFENFEFFIKKRISNLFVINTDREDLMQEATMCFYNSILKYDIDRGAFIYFTRTYITRNIWGLINKSRKHVKNNVSLVSIDSFSNEDSKNNYDDYLYYQMSDNVDIQDNIVAREQTHSFLDQMEETLTDRERKAMYLYLKGASYEDIAEFCEISGKSVDNSLHRAKSKMKSICKPDDFY